MPKKILVIENDSAFAGQLSEALEASGFDVRVAAEGKAGMDLAREWGPDGIVLCVELPGMSGYLVCQKLRKDDVTKAIPLLLTSAEATADTFEKHKALKVHADGYLLKPYTPLALLEKLAAAGVPSAPASPGGPAPAGEASSPEGMTLETLGGEPPAELPSLDLEALPEENAAAPAVDDDLAFLDEAFEGIAAPAASPERERPVGEEDLSAAAASLPAEDEADARAALGEVDLAEEDPLAALGAGEDEPPPSPPSSPETEERTPPLRGASAEALRAAGIPLLDSNPPAPARPRTTLVGLSMPGRPAPAPAPARPPAPEAVPPERPQRELSEARAALAAREAEAKQARGRAEEAVQRAESAESAAAEREAELASVRAKLEAISGQAKKAEQELRAAREEARRQLAEMDELRARLAEAERRLEEAGDPARIEELERELESTRTELLVARNEVEGARGEVAARGEELEKRISELEAQSAKHEERVLKAYQKIKGDEKVKDKVRKAIAIAAQLLEEGLPAEPTPSPEKPRLS
ncbi:MAG TPA: response regulator [Anaeromyxobacter sp.]|nr:response regulator [Anaeromyxobacter sp.]